MPDNQTAINIFVSEGVKLWFNELVATIRKDELTLETGLASPEKEQMYKTFISGDNNKIFSTARASSSMYFIQSLVVEYINKLRSSDIHPLKLLLDVSDAKVLAWAEIKDDDFEMEKTLLLCEAKINAKYFQYGFNLSTTIVEKSDNLPVPEHYQDVLK